MTTCLVVLPNSAAVETCRLRRPRAQDDVPEKHEVWARHSSLQVSYLEGLYRHPYLSATVSRRATHSAISIASVGHASHASLAVSSAPAGTGSAITYASPSSLISKTSAQV